MTLVEALTRIGGVGALPFRSLAYAPFRPRLGRGYVDDVDFDTTPKGLGELPKCF